jgi:hypothetical protein
VSGAGTVAALLTGAGFAPATGAGDGFTVTPMTGLGPPRVAVAWRPAPPAPDLPGELGQFRKVLEDAGCRATVVQAPCPYLAVFPGAATTTS